MELNSKHIQGLIKLVNNSPYFLNQSMVLEDMGIGYSRVRIEVENKHLSPFGAVQGGVYATMIDCAAYFAPYAELGEGVGLISIDVCVNNVASIRSGSLIAKGERVKVGKTICVAQAVIRDGTGQLIAHGTSKLLAASGLQTVSQMVSYSKDKIPPKFL